MAQSVGFSHASVSCYSSNLKSALQIMLGDEVSIEKYALANKALFKGLHKQTLLQIPCSIATQSIMIYLYCFVLAQALVYGRL